MIPVSALALFLATADEGEEMELRLSLVAEHLELEGAAFTAWLEEHANAATYATAPDFDLIHLYQRFEDAKAFAEVMGRYDNYLRGLIFRYVRRLDAVDEVLQLTYCSTIQAMHRFEFTSKFRTYIHRVAVNEALMWLRSERRMRLDPDELALATVQADPYPHEDHKLRARILRAVHQLPDNLRHAFMARYFRHRNVEEGAGELGITPGLFRQRLHRARLHLRTLLVDVAP